MSRESVSLQEFDACVSGKEWECPLGAGAVWHSAGGGLAEEDEFSGQSEVKVKRSDCGHFEGVQQRVVDFEPVLAQKQVSKSTTLK